MSSNFNNKPRVGTKSKLTKGKKVLELTLTTIESKISLEPVFKDNVKITNSSSFQDIKTSAHDSGAITLSLTNLKISSMSETLVSPTIYTSQENSTLNASCKATKCETATIGGRQYILSKTNLYIKGLDKTVTDQYLNDLCKKYGTIISTKAIIDKETNSCKGFGFVDFETVESAQTALTDLKSLGMQVQMAKQQSLDSTNLYIANLPLSMTEPELESLISPHGSVLSIRILKEHPPNIGSKNGNLKSRGVGFARLESRSACENVIASLHGLVLEGSSKPIMCKFADNSSSPTSASNYSYNNNSLKKYNLYHNNNYDKYGNGFTFKSSSILFNSPAAAYLPNNYLGGGLPFLFQPNSFNTYNKLSLNPIPSLHSSYLHGNHNIYGPDALFNYNSLNSNSMSLQLQQSHKLSATINTTCNNPNSFQQQPYLFGYNSSFPLTGNIHHGPFSHLLPGGSPYQFPLLNNYNNLNSETSSAKGLSNIQSHLNPIPFPVPNIQPTNFNQNNGNLIPLKQFQSSTPLTINDTIMPNTNVLAPSQTLQFLNFNNKDNNTNNAYFQPLKNMPKNAMFSETFQPQQMLNLNNTTYIIPVNFGGENGGLNKGGQFYVPCVLGGINTAFVNNNNNGSNALVLNTGKHQSAVNLNAQPNVNMMYPYPMIGCYIPIPFYPPNLNDGGTNGNNVKPNNNNVLNLASSVSNECDAAQNNINSNNVALTTNSKFIMITQPQVAQLFPSMNLPLMATPSIPFPLLNQQNTTALIPNQSMNNFRPNNLLNSINNLNQFQSPYIPPPPLPFMVPSPNVAQYVVNLTQSTPPTTSFPTQNVDVNIINTNNVNTIANYTSLPQDHTLISNSDQSDASIVVTLYPTPTTNSP